jgi:non-specific serine/threonine protein kinase
MLGRLEHPLSILTGGARDVPARHQTLRGAIAWSYQLLSPNEQQLFRRLAVFIGGFALEAAEALCNPGGTLEGELLDGLQALVDSSLMRQEEQSGGEPRFFFLQTIREYGLERLAESGDAQAIREQHALYCLALAEKAAQQLFRPQQTVWLTRLEQEHDNLRAALHWFEEQRQVEQAFRLAGALSWFWVTHGHLTEGRERVARLLSIEAAEHTAGRANALYVAGMLAIHSGDHGAAGARLEESLAIQRELGDKGGIFSALSSLGAVAIQQRDYAAARSHSEEMLSIGKELRNYDFVYHALLNLGNLAHEQRDYSAARSYYERCLAIKRKLGIKVGVFVSLQSLGLVAHDQGDHAAARSFYEESLAIAREMEDHRGTALSLAKLGEVTTAQGDYAMAHSCLEESLTISRSRGDKASMAFAVERLAGLATAQCQSSRALRLAGIATALRQAIGSQTPASARAQLEHRVQPARQALSAEAARAAWAEGQAMSLETAVAYAMSSGVQDA